MPNWTEEEVREAEARAKAPGPVSAPRRTVLDDDDGDGPTMNKTECAFAAHLELQVRAGTVKRWWFESIKFRVGKHCWWNVDFVVEQGDGSVVLYDTKGTRRKKSGSGTSPFTQDDAVVKARAIADKFPWPVYFTWRERSGEWNRKRM